MKKLIPFLMLSLVAFACKDEAANEVDRRPVNGVLLTNSDEAYDEAAKRRSQSEYSARFEIEEVSRNGTSLNIKVSHAHACQGDFEVIWDGSVMESYPMQIRLFVKFNAVCDEGPHIMMLDIKTLEVDLMQLIGDEELINESVFHVSNASSVQDVRYEETTSDK